jgi:hypothetical protein
MERPTEARKREGSSEIQLARPRITALRAFMRAAN